jgi:hypothetical protein
MHHLKQAMQDCIAACLKCYATCHGMAMGHCLEAGGDHTKPEHFRLMIGCADVCRSAAHAMLTGIQQHTKLCATCADVCEACAKDCERVGDMLACVDACRRCAEECRKMAA